MKMIETIKATDYYRLVTKHCLGSSESKMLTITSSLGLLTHVANLDSEVSPREVSYLKRYLKDEFELNQNQYRELVSGFNFIYSKDKINASLLHDLKIYLKETLTSDELEHFLNALLTLSTSDKQMDNIEKQFIQNVGMVMEIDQQSILESILSKNLELIQKIDAEIEADSGLKTDQNELNRITFVSTHEFMKSFE